MDSSLPQDHFIDAHHHLWRYQDPGQPWMTDEMSYLRRDIGVEDLRNVATPSGITGTVVVEVERTVEETRWLASTAASDDLILGVVGWADLTDPSVEAELEQLAELPNLRGVRHPIHDEPDPNFVLREDFNRGIAALHALGLTYDLLIFEDHLPQTIHFVDRHPDQIFILDHIAKPRIRDASITAWRSNLLELARRPNVYCKLSGVVTEAKWDRWTPQMIAPYIDTVLEAFGPRRLMFGSDWPIVTLASTYDRWVNTVRSAIAQLSTSEQQAILWRSATEAYGLRRPVAHSHV
ncbi:amidohydrolase family protein [Edaphobacter aggregans]|uniref:amidohydrolase family protein n=1 Tax=Edaphobacter aggregans TaxID=570835 RepID=UPI000557452F|nr:amidohydrolase family protein [Edaphobacter aggregans]